MDRLYNSALQAKKKEKFKKLSDQTEREEEEGFQIIYYSQFPIFIMLYVGQNQYHKK